MLKSPNAILTLVAINVGAYLAIHLLNINVMEMLALYYPGNPKWWFGQFLTHIFIHGGLTHILFNMYGLWAFGTPLLKLWGSTRFVLFFLITGIGAGLIFTLVNYLQFTALYEEIHALNVSAQAIQALLEKGQVPNNLTQGFPSEKLQELFQIYHSPVVGASGAIYAILVAFAVLFPNAKMMLIFIPYPIKAMYFVPIIILGDVFFGMTRYSVGNIAHFAHVGGAIMGLAIVLVWRWRYKGHL